MKSGKLAPVEAGFPLIFCGCKCNVRYRRRKPAHSSDSSAGFSNA